MSTNLAISLVIGASVGSAIAGIKKLQNEIGIFRNSTLTAGQKMGALGKNAVTAFSTATSLATGLGASVLGLAQPAIKFESAMADVKKVVDFKTPEGFKNLSKDILNLTRTLPMSAEELASITASGGQLGIAEADLKDFTTTIAKMSVAFDMSAADSGDAMAKLANVYKIPIKEIGKLGDAINELSNSSPAKASDIVSTLGRIGGTAKQFGLTETAAASLANSFISLGKAPEVAGTAINGMLTKLMTAEKGGKAFQAALKTVGISAKELKGNIAKDGQAALIDFLRRLEKLPKDQAMGVLVDLFGREYADDVAVLAGNVDVLTNSIQTLQEVDEQGNLKYLGSMEKEFASRSATTENNLQLLKNSITEVGITIGSVLLPPINKFINVLKPVIHSIADWATANPGWVEGIMMVGGAIAGAAIGFFAFKAILSTTLMVLIPVFKVLKMGVTAIVTVVKFLWFLTRGVLFLTKVLWGVTKAIFIVGKALLMNPIGIAAIAIAGAAYLIWRNWEPIKSAFIQLWSNVVTAFNNAANWIKTTWSSVSSWFSNAWAVLKGYFNTGINAISQFIRNFDPLSVFQSIWATVINWATEIWSVLSGLFLNGVTAVASTIMNFNPLAAFQSAWGAINGWATNVWAELTGFFGSGIGNITATILSWNPLSLFVNAMSSVLSYFGVTLPASFTGFGKNIIDGLVGGIQKTWTAAKEKVSELGNSIKSWFASKLGIKSPSRVFMGFGQNTVEGLVIGIGKKIPLANKMSHALANSISTPPVVSTEYQIETKSIPALTEVNHKSAPDKEVISKTIVFESIEEGTLSPPELKKEITNQNDNPVHAAVSRYVTPMLRPIDLIGKVWKGLMNVVQGSYSSASSGDILTTVSKENEVSGEGKEKIYVSLSEKLGTESINQDRGMEKRETNSRQSSSVHVNFNPTIQVSMPNSTSVVEQVQEGLKISMYEFERVLEQILDQRQRRAY